jgi:predicted Zn finger-like uncharacterized protein
MILACAKCGTKYKIDEARFRGKKVKCPKCAEVFTVPDQEALEATVAPSTGSGPFSLKDTTKVMNAQKLVDEAQAKALGTTGKRYSIAVLSGPLSGQVVKVAKSVFVIGRAYGDLVLPDTEASRKHCQIEIGDDGKVTLRDAGSTNGTFVMGSRIEEAPLEDKTEFSVGKTSLMFIVASDD